MSSYTSISSISSYSDFVSNKLEDHIFDKDKNSAWSQLSNLSDKDLKKCAEKIKDKALVKVGRGTLSYLDSDAILEKIRLVDSQRMRDLMLNKLEEKNAFSDLITGIGLSRFSKI